VPLQNSASRIFEHKAGRFEALFLEPILNAMLEIGRRNLDRFETVQGTNEDTGSSFFLEIQKSDLLAQGKLIPVGARHFAERARRVQNLTQLMQVKASDPSVAPHLSGKEIARILAQELGEERIFGENIAIEEQAQTQNALSDAEANVQEELMAKAEVGR
jgi:hypothetical protein